MTSKNRITGVEIKRIVYTIQREGGCVHTISVDPVDSAMQCTCPAGVHGRLCWAQRIVIAGEAPKPKVRVRVAPLKSVRAWSQATIDTMHSLDVG